MWHRRRQPAKVELELHIDAVEDDERPTETRRDIPLSYSPERREYGWREVAQTWVQVENPETRQSARPASIDWMAAVSNHEEQ